MGPSIGELQRFIRIKLVEAPCPVIGLDGNCWLWTGSVDEHGYGKTTINYKAYRIHCFSYELFVGPRTEGLTIDHLCRVRRCCNPKHLEEVPHRINVLRGRGLASVNAIKTTCVYGHPLTGDNLALFKGPHHGRLTTERSCRICNRRRSKEWYDRDKERRANG